MIPFYHSIAGRIFLKENQSPIQGLLVKVTAGFGSHWEKGNDCVFHLSCDLTNREGHFWVTIVDQGFMEACRCKGHLEFCVKVFDRDGHQIHEECRKAEGCPQDTTFRFDISLESEDVKCHLARPLSWDCPEEPLLPDWVMDDIEEAFEILGKESAERWHPSLSFLLCAKPVLTIFDDILQDAWKTLDGDLDSANRFRDAMDSICSYHRDGCCDPEASPHFKAIDDIMTEACEVDPCKPVKLEPKTPCCRLDKPACPDRELLVSDEKVAILAMAVFHISCGHPETARTYLVAILDQVCRFQFLSALHRAAVETICNKPLARSHFRNLLELLACYCSPAQKSVPYAQLCDAIPCCPICVGSALLDCIRDAYRNWCAIRCYKVTNIVPKRACPGDKVVICGCGFGYEPGWVRFVEKGGMTLGPPTKVESWSDDRICVVVPDHAGCGLVLLSPVDTINVCDRFLDYRQTGSFLEVFEGTNSQILKFVIKGHQNDDCLLPGEVLKIRWKTCAVDHVVVRIVNNQTGAVIAELNPAPARGRWDFENTGFNQTTRVKVEITATGKCKPPTVSREITVTFQRPPDLKIDGVEVTQAIQYYRAASHLTDPADRGADNSLQLVANKSAWVRTYLRSGQDPGFDMGQLANVSGTMTVERRVGGIWSVVTNLVPVNAPVTAQDSFPSYDAERSDITASLNFVVPANVMTGLLRFTIRVSSPDDCYGGIATSVQQIDLDLDQELRIAAVSVGYNGPPTGGGPNVSFAAPTAAQIAAEANFSLRVYPVRSVPNIRIIDTQNATQPLNDNNIAAGGCDDNWGPILNMVVNARTNDGNQAGWFYYGFVSANMPRIHSNVGCANGLNGAGLLGSGTTLAHEIGHQAGLNHAPCGAVGTVTGGFPLYEPYDTGVTTTNSSGNTVWQDASIGEYGLDINDGAIFSPNPARPNNGKDLMSYCGNRWVSLFLHTYMVNNDNFNPVALSTGVSRDVARSGAQQSGGNDVKPFITILGKVLQGGKVVVTSLVRVPTRELTMTGVRTNYVVELIGEDGEVASSAPVFTMPAHEGTGCGCGGNAKERAKPPFSFIAALSDVTEGSAVRICKDTEVVWERQRPKSRLVVQNVQTRMDKDGLFVSWKFAEKAPKETEVWLRWSKDSKSWNGLAVGLRGSSATVDPATIPASNVKLQVLVHDGFRSASAESEMIELPESAPSLAILHPRDGQRFRPGSPLHLWGALCGSPRDEEPTWFIDDEEVSTGLDTWTALPGAGEHRIELRADGIESAMITIIISEDLYHRLQ